jgi:hypothetical protein
MHAFLCEIEFFAMVSIYVASCILKFFIKSGKHNTSTLSLVQNWVRFKNNLQKNTLAFKGGL